MRVAIFILALTLAACGGGPSVRESSGAPGDGGDYFIAVARARTPLLREDARSIEELEAARDRARGAERRRALLDLAQAHMLVAGESSSRDERRHRAQAERYASAAATGSRDSEILAASAFIELWLAYRAGDRNAAARAARFTTRFAQSGELVLLAWVMRGELALSGEEWDSAATAYRYVLGQLEHPLYAYALYRTAETQERSGRREEARATLEEVARLGCSPSASEPTRQVALRAARAHGMGMRRGEDGVERPENCPASTREDDAVGGWRPAE